RHARGGGCTLPTLAALRHRSRGPSYRTRSASHRHRSGAGSAVNADQGVVILLQPHWNVLDPTETSPHAAAHPSDPCSLVPQAGGQAAKFQNPGLREPAGAWTEDAEGL